VAPPPIEDDEDNELLSLTLSPFFGGISSLSTIQEEGGGCGSSEILCVKQ